MSNVSRYTPRASACSTGRSVSTRPSSLVTPLWVWGLGGLVGGLSHGCPMDGMPPVMRPALQTTPRLSWGGPPTDVIGTYGPAIPPHQPPRAHLPTEAHPPPAPRISRCIDTPRAGWPSVVSRIWLVMGQRFLGAPAMLLIDDDDDAAGGGDRWRARACRRRSGALTLGCCCREGAEDM